MKRYPASQNAEFKRLTLLMTNLPNKRLRDVSLRVKYMKAKEKQDISWESFLHSSFGQQRVEVSPSHSIKSPRATPTDRDDQPKRSRRTPIRIKKEDDDLSMSSNSNQVSSVNSSTINVRDANSMSISSNAPPPLVTTMAQPITIQHPQIQVAPQPRVTVPQSAVISQPPNPSYPRPNAFPQNSYLPSSIGRTAPIMYQTRDRGYSLDDQTCDHLIGENERCLEAITATVMRKQGDFGDYISVFSSNVNRLLQITERMTANLPLFYFSPININPPKFKKVDLPQEPIRIQPTYGLEFQLGKGNVRDISIDGRRDIL
ncbi:hypothetical protein EDI_067220 [Entamoeba dispar SAW760]|uniref:Uncharacterized protein n=1 Tax=Entamoeba dispar (strain ATCC PRA-260 / SAW760) TaxID=370354 RepID=B0EG03_ENTDS|nr:uncharacterized protein EDI_067220 [Entamoeba dispar SAW760]EDR26554.1 hypothetical protein EDI_067220 [Entamoeba dispar SAW760]|eukprot:EDR26554.1 hypothetical protein EDI_067220 [Entamoeba dispar SAW760]